MNTILIILALSVLFLYAKWIFCILYYPLMALGAMGQRASNRKVSYALRFPMKVAEHFLRFGGEICPVPDRHDSFCSPTHMALQGIGSEDGEKRDNSLSYRTSSSRKVDSWRWHYHWRQCHLGCQERFDHGKERQSF